jgi:O-antigen/teichoic acid export membrane protein
VGYIEATVALRLISLAIIGATYSGILITCVNLPMKREKYNLYATVVAAIVNVVLNIYFIPHYKEKGAAITTVIAEFTVFIMIFCGLSYKKLKELIYFKDVIRNIITGVAECAIMIGISTFLNAYTDNLFVVTGLLIVLTIITYALLLIATKNPILNKFKFTRRFASNA